MLLSKNSRRISKFAWIGAIAAKFSALESVEGEFERLGKGKEEKKIGELPQFANVTIPGARRCSRNRDLDHDLPLNSRLVRPEGSEGQGFGESRKRRGALTQPITSSSHAMYPIVDSEEGL
jgi:hypothetical protein